MNDASLENELASLSLAEIRRRIDDMHELINDPSWSGMAKLGAMEYLPMLQFELNARGHTYRDTV